MTGLTFAPATRSEAKARVALVGPTGAGKTWTALEWATVLAKGGRIAVIDTENGSASLYSDQYKFDTASWPPPYTPLKLVNALEHAASEYDVIVIDSLTHFWQGQGGVLEIVGSQLIIVGRREAVALEGRAGRRRGHIRSHGGFGRLWGRPHTGDLIRLQLILRGCLERFARARDRDGRARRSIDRTHRRRLPLGAAPAVALVRCGRRGGRVPQRFSSIGPTPC